VEGLLIVKVLGKLLKNKPMNQIPYGIFIPGQNYKFPDDINESARINVNRLIEQVRMRLKNGQKGFFDYYAKKDNTKEKYDLYTTIASIIIKYEIGDIDEYLSRKDQITEIINTRILPLEKEILFYDAHLTAKFILAMNLLGIPNLKSQINVGVEDFKEYMEENIDWNGTLKDFWGTVAVSFAKKGFDENNAEVVEYLNKKFEVVFEQASKDQPRVMVSKLYHFIGALDFLNMEYPNPEKIIDFFLDLDYIDQRKTCERTVCTDFDLAYMLKNYALQSGYRVDEVQKLLKKLSLYVVNEWNDDIDLLKDFTTFHLFDFLVSTSVFQSISPELYTGPVIPDIYHNISLYRVN
jgi:hypothetical protein